jgi:hypothetical protein
MENTRKLVHKSQISLWPTGRPRTDVGSLFDHHVARERSCNAGNVKTYTVFEVQKDPVCNSHFVISDMIYPYEKCINTYKNVH